MTDLPTTLHGITVDYSRDSLFDSLGLERLKDSYMMEHEVSPQERFAYVSKAFGSNPEHAQRLYDYSSKHWLSYSTPILAYGRNKRGLAISCFAAGTPVMTDCGLKSIEDLVPGDMVLSHDGTFNTIVATKESQSDDVYELTINGEVFHVTGNHLILTQEGGWIRADALDPAKHTLIQIQDPTFQPHKTPTV